MKNALFACLLCAATCAAAPPLRSAPTGSPAGAPPSTWLSAPDSPPLAAPAHSSVLEDLKIEKGSLEDLVAKLRVESGLNIIVQREANVSPNYPVISAMELKNVTAPQVLDTLAQAHDNLEIAPVTDRTQNVPTTIYVVKVKAPGQSPFVQPSAPSQPDETVKVYNLAQYTLFEEGAQPAKTRANDILTLLQAVLDETAGNRATIKFHEPTLSVIIKGTAEQHLVVDDTLKTMTMTDARKPADFEHMDAKDLQTSLDWFNQRVQLIQKLMKQQPAGSTTQP